jgi:hypothetical protein
VRVVADRRLGTSVAPIAVVVLPLNGLWRLLALADRARRRVDAGDEPVEEGAARSIRVLAQESELDRAVGRVGPFQRR